MKLTQRELADALGTKHNSVYPHPKKYRALDSYGKEMVDFTLLKEWERSTNLTKKVDSLSFQNL